MNELFVHVKVDREERPDVDQIYMDTVVRLTGHGGWPLTVFCTPDGSPFYGGTYFPPEPRQGCPSFRAGAARRGAGLARAARRGGGQRRPDPRRRCARGRAAWRRRCPARETLARAARAAPGARRPRARRLRRRAEVPDAAEPRARCSRRSDVLPEREARDALALRRLHLPRDGAARPLRPARRRLPPLLRRRALGRSALREDALRPGPAPARLRRGVAPHRRRATTTSSGRSARPSRACAARCARRTAASSRARTPTARARRASSTSGRRTRCARCSAPERGDAFCAAYGVTPRRQLRARHERALGRGARAARRASRRSAPSCSPRAAKRIPPGTDREARRGLERARDLGARARGQRCSATRSCSPTPSPPRSSCSPSSATRDGRLLRVYAERARASSAPSSTTHAALLAAFLDLHRAGAGERWLEEALALADADRDALLRRRRGRPLPHAGRRRARSCTARAPTTTAPRRTPRAWRCSGSCAPPRSRAASDLRRVAERVLREPRLRARARGARATRRCSRAAVAGGARARVAVVVGEPADAATRRARRAARAACSRRRTRWSWPRPAQPPPGLDAAWLAGRALVDGRPAAYVCHGTECSLPSPIPRRSRKEMIPWRLA